SPAVNPLIVPAGPANPDSSVSTNPYLQTSPPPPPIHLIGAKDIPASFAPPSSGSNPSLMPPTGIPSREQAKPTVNEPLRPADDARLFKQLKRF
ncbi:MAG: hypothetical protein ABIV50_00105, partial [Opitutus sp.]